MGVKNGVNFEVKNGVKKGVNFFFHFISLLFLFVADFFTAPLSSVFHLKSG